MIRQLASYLEPGKLTLNLPIRTVSEANCSQPWQIKHKRHKAQKKAIHWAMGPFKSQIKMPCKITLIRYAPKTLDSHDNLPMSLKYITDAVCESISGDYCPGRADDKFDFSFSYDQVKSKTYHVKIVIEF